MTGAFGRATVRRWTRGGHPNPWEYRVGTTSGHVATWQRAFDRVQQLIADQT